MNIQDIAELPEAILVDIDYDVLHILYNIGLINSEYDEYNDPDAWNQFYNQDYHGLFVLLDDSGADYRAVWGYSGNIPDLYKSLDLLWFEDELLV